MAEHRQSKTFRYLCQELRRGTLALKLAHEILKIFILYSPLTEGQGVGSEIFRTSPIIQQL